MLNEAGEILEGTQTNFGCTVVRACVCAGIRGDVGVFRSGGKLHAQLALWHVHWMHRPGSVLTVFTRGRCELPVPSAPHNRVSWPRALPS
jgi:hypothetical protein